MKKQYLECGKIITTHGLRGEVKVEPWCDSPDFLTHFATLYLKKGEQPIAVEAVRVHKNMAIVKLKGVDSIDDAVTLRGKIVYINRDDAPEDDGSYFVQDLIGLRVTNVDTKRDYGRLVQVLATGANDVYVIEDEEGTQRLIPAIPQVVVAMNVEGGTMEIRPLKGLFDDED